MRGNDHDYEIGGDRDVFLIDGRTLYIPVEQPFVMVCLVAATTRTGRLQARGLRARKLNDNQHGAMKCHDVLKCMRATNILRPPRPHRQPQRR